MLNNYNFYIWKNFFKFKKNTLCDVQVIIIFGFKIFKLFIK